MSIDYYEGEWRRKYKPLLWQKQGLTETASGYGARLTSSDVAVLEDGTERRIYITQYGNAGSAWIVMGGRRLYLGEPIGDVRNNPRNPIRSNLRANPGIWPSIRDVAEELTAQKKQLRRIMSREDLMDEDGEGGSGTDVRLQVTADGGWAIHTGLSDYDQDHRGYWGASWLPVYSRGSMRELAKDLIDQARDQAAY